MAASFLNHLRFILGVLFFSGLPGPSFLFDLSELILARLGRLQGRPRTGSLEVRKAAPWIP